MRNNVMRVASFTLAASLLGISAVWAQPPAIPGSPVPGVPVVQPPVAAAKAADPKLDAHLAEWEKKMSKVVNLRTEVELSRTEPLFKKATTFSGSVLCMKPNLAVLRLNNTADKSGRDYEAYICDGKAVYAYNGVAKTVTEFKLPQGQAGVDNLMLDFLAGMKAKDAKDRFEIELFKVDANYIYLDIKPRFGKDQREFKHIRLALYGPGEATKTMAYLPAQVYLMKPNDETEMWAFKNPQVDLPGVEAKLFQYVEIKDKEWKFQQATPAPGGGGAPLPPGGAVRPNK
jgi:TIGR03009 family protein